jgi:hypothetical protein
MQNKFSSEQIELLQSLIGGTLSYVAGPNLSPNLISDYVIIALESTFIGLQGDIYTGNFEGFAETYSTIRISTADPSEVSKSRDKGNQYFFKKNEKISELFLVRDEIRGFQDGNKSWDYVTDVGVVLQLESGIVAISKLSYHDEMLQVTYLKDLQLEKIPETLGRFENNLHSNFTTARSLVRL